MLNNKTYVTNVKCGHVTVCQCQESTLQFVKPSFEEAKKEAKKLPFRVFGPAEITISKVKNGFFKTVALKEEGSLAWHKVKGVYAPIDDELSGSDDGSDFEENIISPTLPPKN